MKMGWAGKESAGKSQLMVVHSWKTFKRNVRWRRKRLKKGLEDIPRTMAFDTPISPWYISQIEKAGLKYLFFKDLKDIMHLTQVDIHINEINKFFPQRGSDPLDREQAEFLSQAAKLGVDIYFCTQDFSQAHKQFRFLVNKMYHVKKLCGSIRPIASAPPIKYIWGIVLIFPIDPDSFKGDNFSMKLNGLPSVYWINKKDTELYETLYKVQGTKPPPVKMVRQELWYLNDDGDVVEKKEKWIKK